MADALAAAAKAKPTVRRASSRDFEVEARRAFLSTSDPALGCTSARRCLFSAWTRDINLDSRRARRGRGRDGGCLRRRRDRRFAAWVHESDEGLRADLSGRGYAIDESTRAMGLALEDASAPKSEIDLGPLAWSEYLEFLHAFGLPRGCSVAPTRMPFTSLALESPARTSPRRSPLTLMATVASTACPRSRRRATADWGPRLQHVSSTTP